MSGSDRPAVRWSLRSAVAEDAPAVSRIWVQGWADGHLGHVPVSLAAARTDDWFARRAGERVQDMTVAEAGGSVVGFTVVIADEVEQLYVDRAARGTGVAEALLVEAERQIRATGGQAWLAVAVGNARARRFYERCGWRDEGDLAYRAVTDEGPVVVPCRRYVAGPQ